MKLYGLIEKVWIIDEHSYAGNDYTIEMFDSRARRDERLLYLNGGWIVLEMCLNMIPGFMPTR